MSPGKYPCCVHLLSSLFSLFILFSYFGRGLGWSLNLVENLCPIVFGLALLCTNPEKQKKQKEINALITVDVRSRNWGISRGVYTRIFHICWGIFDHCQDRSHAMIIDV